MQAGILKVFVLLVMTLVLPGCATVGYYSHIMNGHHALMEGEEAIEDILTENKYDEPIRERLKRAQAIRRFASEELALPDNDSYKNFVKLDRKYPVWNVIAAEKYAINAKQWCFMFVGCLSYRGYFNEQAANLMAKQLSLQGYDVIVSPAAAYSTLGWFDDPLLSSMLYKEDAHLAGIIFHELAHQKVYIDNDSSFNEAFATAVELEGIRRWLAAYGDARGVNNYRQYKQRQRDFNALLKTTREELKKLYKTEKNETVLDVNKKRIIVEMKQGYQRLKKQWGGHAAYDKWFARDINNADLALVATYHELVPAFEALLKQQDYNLVQFYEVVRDLGKQNKASRSAVLERLGVQKLARY